MADHPPRRRPARAARLAVAIVAAWAALSGAPARAQNPDEYAVKAVFLFNFAQFVEWPDSAFPSPDAPFVIGILGSDPFSGTIDSIVQGETVNGRAFAVIRYRNAAELRESPCHILYVGDEEDARASVLHAAIGARAVLTVGESGRFVANGGVVQFLVVNKKVRIRINLGAARDHGLTVSSKLLRVAEVVDGPTLPPG